MSDNVQIKKCCNDLCKLLKSQQLHASRLAFSAQITKPPRLTSHIFDFKELTARSADQREADREAKALAAQAQRHTFWCPEESL
jgi:hypothetical protein